MFREDTLQETAPNYISNVKKLDVGEPHHTLMHQSQKENATKLSQTQTGASEDKGTTQKEVSNEQGSFGTATRNNGGSRICLRAVPVKIRTINGVEEIQTYTVLDNGSEVTLCDDRLVKRLRIDSEIRINWNQWFSRSKRSND